MIAVTKPFNRARSESVMSSAVTTSTALVGAGIAGVAELILGPAALAMFFVLLEVYYKEQIIEQPTSNQ